MEWNSILDPTRNEVTAGSVMPADGSSIAGASTGTNVARQVTQTGGAQASAGMIMPAGNLVVGLVVFIVLLVILMFVAHKWGGESNDFSSIRASAYNVLLIAFVAVIGIPVIKVGAWKLADLGIPGAGSVAQWALAA